MRLLRITIAALLGTSFMTAFSYAVSEASNKQFREPELLNKLVRRFPLTEVSPADNNATGWILHYAVGFLFTVIYDPLWHKSIIKVNTKSGLVLGALSGLFGILVWKLTFKFHPQPPNTDLKKFFYQLFIAHLIFGYFAMLGYKFSPDDAKIKSFPIPKKIAHQGK